MLKMGRKEEYSPEEENNKSKLLHYSGRENKGGNVRKRRETGIYQDWYM